MKTNFEIVNARFSNILFNLKIVFLFGGGGGGGGGELPKYIIQYRVMAWEN